MRSKLIVMTAMALALGGCNRPNTDADHPNADYTTSLLSRMSAIDIEKVTTPAAPPERGPIPPEANAADPATNASLAFANSSGEMARVPAPGSDNTPEGQHLAALADDAAARAPDTAAADEAKRKVYEDAARGVLASAPDALAKAPVSKAEAQQPSGSEPMTSLPSKPSDSGTMSPAPDNSSTTSDATTAESNSSSSPRVEKT